MLKLYLILVMLIHFDGFFLLKLNERINNSSLSSNHGQLLGYFTFTDGGVAGLSYKISPLLNSTNLALHIFPMAYDSFTNMQQMRNHYTMQRCKDYYSKAIHSVPIVYESDRATLGRFSGGFSVAVILSNKYVCKQPSVLFEEDEDSLMDLEVNLFNGDNEAFKNHLSGTDMGMNEIVMILLFFHVVIIIIVLYSMKYSLITDVLIMLLIQKIVALMVLCQIIICILLSTAYTSFLDTGILPLKYSLTAEVLGVFCRYLELYIIASWTLSNPRDVHRHINIVAQVVAICAICHISLTLFHYLFTFGSASTVGCFSVWDCEPHIYSIGWGNPVQYYETAFGWGAILMNWGANGISSLFVIHLLKVGLHATRLTVRRAYISVFCSVSLLWFWSYAGIWILSSLVTDYWQYKMVILLVTVSHMCGTVIILRVTRIIPTNMDILPSSVIIY